MSRVFRIFAVELLIWICFCTVALENAAVFPFRPEWPFLSRFPGFWVPGGTTYHIYRETPLNRKFGKIKVGRVVVRKSRTTKDNYLMAGNKTIKIYSKNFGN